MYIVLFSAFLLSYFVIVQPFGYASQEKLVDDVPITDISAIDVDAAYSSEMYIVFENNEYHLYVNGVAASVVSEENLSMPPFTPYQYWRIINEALY